MNKIGINQCKDILDSFAWDSTGHAESPGIKARERADSHIFYFRDWFNIVTDRGLRESKFFNQNKNSFSEKRNNFNEPGKVSLCILDRERLASLRWKEEPQFWAKLFNQLKYTREQRERSLLTYLTNLNYSNSLLKKFLDIYFYIETYSKEESAQFLAKCYEQNERMFYEKQQLKANAVKKSESLTKSSIEERLIAKAVKKRTNYGKEYNQNSLYDTVEDCLANGEDLVFEPSKQAQADAVVNYLKYLNMEQRIIALRIQELELNKEENALQDEISSLKQQLTLLQEKHRAKQQERSNLKQEENKLQQEQDNLLR